MDHKPNWPVVRPLPRLAVKMVVYGMFCLGLILLWKDRRESNKNDRVRSGHKAVGIPAYK